MHREITYADRAFGQEQSRLSLYLLTGLIGLILALDLWPFLVAWLDGLGLSLPRWPNEVYGYRLALIAAVVGGARLLYGSLDSLLQGRLGADLALAIACIAAILVREPLVAAELVFVGLLGECLEHLTFERTRHAVRRLAELTPRRCWRLRDGQEERVLVSDLQVGDQVVVKPGAKVPVDGIVLAGRSAVDVSMLTGESLPVDRGPGDEVLAGSLNQHGALTIEARRLAEHTVLGRVIEMTARALRDRAPIERTADVMARYFLPVVLALATLTFLTALGLHYFGIGRSGDVPRPGFAASIRYAVYPALSVLVVACPCALILATPAAIIAALGRLAGTGVLLKGGSALERLAGVNVFAFDKTGTLTEGKLELGDVVPLGDTSVEELLRLAASIEQQSEHPLARLLVEQARSRQIALETPEEFLAHPGAGVAGRLSAGQVLVGNRRLLEEQGIALTADTLALIERLDAAGQTVLLVSLNGRVVGGLGARDRVREEARTILDELRLLGIERLVMLTGDRPAVARHIADSLGLSEAHAELLPQQKAERIAAWQQQQPTLKVAMVGDGINDAPALVTASVGLAIGGTGNDVASEAGDVVLLLGTPGTTGEAVREPLRHLPLLLRLSRQTVRIIRQNILFFAFGVNVAGIVLTAWLWPLLAPPGWFETGPLAAVLYHQVGSLLVLLNSMRLLWFERPASPTVRCWQEWLARCNDWMEKRLDLDELLHGLLHRWGTVLAVTLSLAGLAYFASGLIAVHERQVGLVRRFGRLLDEELQPGLHLRWPWPVETITLIEPQKIYTVELGFRSQAGSRGLGESRSWSSLHGDGFSREPEEAVVLTGDGNLLEVQASVRYRIAQPRVFFFGVNRPEKTLRNRAESVLREVVAGQRMADLLTGDLSRFQSEVQRRLEAGCEELGVELDGLSLHDLHPPQEVVRAYYEVTQAMERRDWEVNTAEADRLSRRRTEQARAVQTVRQAQADKFERIRTAQARQAEFLARSTARNTLSLQAELELLGELIEGLQAGRLPTEVAARYRLRRDELLQTQAMLTDFRLYWDTLAGTLAGRPKVLVDTDRLPGRRSLWLAPFEPPAQPTLMPRGDPTRRNRGAIPADEP